MPIQPINNVALNYEERGDRTKPSIVLAGPLLFGAQGFDHLVPLLENDFHLVLLDVHGHGRSGIRVPLVLEDMAEDFHELLLRLGLSKPVWVGHSIGGMLGMRIACKYPDEFAALILIATTARLDPPALREQTWQLWQAFRAGERGTIVDPALPFFFAQATFRERPELIRISRLDHQLCGPRECLSIRAGGIQTNGHYRVSASDCCACPRHQRKRRSGHAAE
jgi:pimeloyl-ACP methyl ester carboxylesterase